MSRLASTDPEVTTNVFRPKRGVLVHRTCIQLPVALAVSFRAKCIQDRSSMSATVERWAAEYVASERAAR